MGKQWAGFAAGAMFTCWLSVPTVALGQTLKEQIVGACDSDTLKWPTSML